MVRVDAASAFDLLESLSDEGGRQRVTRARFGEMARQVSEGPALTLRDEAGVLVAVVGLWPEADHAEAWLAVGPAFRGHLLGALRQIRDAMAFVALASGTPEVRAYVRQGAGRVAGARMAAWLGFEKAGIEMTPIGPVDVFCRDFGGGADGTADQELFRRADARAEVGADQRGEGSGLAGPRRRGRGPEGKGRKGRVRASSARGGASFDDLAE